ncbi:hypothetical protein B0H14DRAFT_3105884 [Mycena olivaceomarginata]|nr:hypothetical protein B0H14DRAFT_3105884 [Mycena olivaceomarginata]
MCQSFAKDTGKQHIYVLHGLGGAGKTQIALKFIEESTRFTDRVVVDASTTETIDLCLKKIATAKKIGGSVQDALKWFATGREEWLLFFDNADDPNINLNKFFPKCNHGNIIITSRNPNLLVYGAQSQVSDMEHSDAVALLLTRIVIPPLAIVQAGAFISESGGVLDSYLGLYIENSEQLLRRRPAQTHDDYAEAQTVYTTWQMSFDRLSPAAAMFLQLCSFLHRDGISEEIFSRAAKYIVQSQISSNNGMEKAQKFLSQFMGSTGEWDAFCFVECVKEIMAYSLMSFDPQSKLFSMHPLVHSWSRTTITDEESYRSCISAILGMSIQGIPECDMFLAGLTLVSHVDSLMPAIHKVASNFYQNYATIYYYVGQYKKAAELQGITLETRRRLFGDDHLHTLYAMQNLASTYHSLGQYEEAEKLEVVVLEKRRKVLGDDHLDTLQAMHNLASTYQSLGRTYQNLGRYEEAKKLEAVVLEKRRKVLGDDHLDTLYAMHNLASTYHSLRQYEEAKKLEVVVLEKRRKLLGDDRLGTLHAMHKLASIYQSLGRYEEAEKLEAVVLEKRRKLLEAKQLGFYGAREV